MYRENQFNLLTTKINQKHKHVNFFFKYQNRLSILKSQKKTLLILILACERKISIYIGIKVVERFF